VIRRITVQRVGSLAATHVDFAVIAATNRDLRANAATGRFGAICNTG
jgi:transcriptional regulator with GAF, ATPase, and Fis domain